MPRTIALLFATTLIFTLNACDSGDENPVEERAAEATDAVGPDGLARKHGKHGKHGKHNPADRLCAELECTDAQAAEIAALMSDLRPERDAAAHEARKAARGEAHEAIAAAFRAESFDVSVLERVAPERGDEREREAKMLSFATELHALLTPEQRAKLADRVAEGGPMLFGHHKRGKGKHGKHGDWNGKKAHEGEGEAKRDPAEKIAAKVGKFCEPIACTEAQVGQLTATFTDAHAARRAARAEHEADKPDFAPVAELLRADTLDQAKLRVAMAERRAEGGEHKGARAEHMGALLAEVHGILTPEQRAIVADKIAAEGIHGLLGKGGKGHEGGKHRGKHGGKGKHGDPERDAG
jgi:Spy/CpxP family protein refolding chaperone